MVLIQLVVLVILSAYSLRPSRAFARRAFPALVVLVVGVCVVGGFLVVGVAPLEEPAEPGRTPNPTGPQGPSLGSRLLGNLLVYSSFVPLSLHLGVLVIATAAMGCERTNAQHRGALFLIATALCAFVVAIVVGVMIYRESFPPSPDHNFFGPYGPWEWPSK